MKTNKPVSVAVVLLAVFVASETRTLGASACDLADTATHPACCGQTGAVALPRATSAKLPTLALAADTNTAMRFEIPVTAGVTKLMFQANESLLTSAATDLKATRAFEFHSSGQSATAIELVTNDFASLEVLAAYTPGKETKTFPLEFSGRADTLSGATELLSVRSDFRPRSDALISGSKTTGFSFSFSRSPHSKSSRKAVVNREWLDRTAADVNQFPQGQIWGGNDANREPEGLRLFSWRW